MSNWLEKAEENQKHKESLINSFENSNSEVIDSNIEDLNPILNKLSFLVDRVSKISIEFRRPSLEIGFTSLKGDPVYEFFGSAYLNINHRNWFFKKRTELNLCWRRIFFKIPSEPNRVKITIYEKCTSEINKTKTNSIREKYKFKISDLNEDLAQDILDWLVFKNNTDYLKNKLPKTQHVK